MTKMAVKVQCGLNAFRTAARSRGARRGLTLVEYVLGAAMVVAVMFLLRSQLTGVAETVMNNVRDGVN